MKMLDDASIAEQWNEATEILTTLHHALGEPAFKLAVASLVSTGANALIFSMCAANVKES